MKTKSIEIFSYPKKLLHRLFGKGGDLVNKQQGSEYYDKAFEENNGWRKHYTRSPYYIIWTVIIDRLRRCGSRKVLEIGCGPGQLASAVCDSGIVDSYVGIDFSSKGISYARLACPRFQFEHADALETDLIEKLEYDTVLTTEFLEHVERDIDIIRRIRLGVRFIATVPNFPYVSHVRHFENPEEAFERYGSFFEDFSIVVIPANEQGKKFFLMEGTRVSATH